MAAPSEKASALSGPLQAKQTLSTAATSLADDKITSQLSKRVGYQTTTSPVIEEHNQNVGGKLNSTMKVTK